MKLFCLHFYLQAEMEISYPGMELLTWAKTLENPTSSQKGLNLNPA
jgi:hypothetical protein